MNAEMLRAIYGYDRWATDRVLEAARALTVDQWTAPGTAGHGSIRGTLVHLVDVHQGWRSWWDGSLPPAEAYALALDADAFPDAAALQANWTNVAAATQRFVWGLSDADAARVFEAPQPDGNVFRMVLWQMMLHVANHGTQHRSEVAPMMTAAGHSPGKLDYLNYVMAGGNGAG